MEQNTKDRIEGSEQDATSGKIPTEQLPDWHPFAVWKSQIRSEQMEATGKFQTLKSADV